MTYKVVANHNPNLFMFDGNSAICEDADGKDESVFLTHVVAWLIEDEGDSENTYVSATPLGYVDSARIGKKSSRYIDWFGVYDKSTGDWYITSDYSDDYSGNGMNDLLVAYKQRGDEVREYFEKKRTASG
jgi:hypothetical protein